MFVVKFVAYNVVCLLNLGLLLYRVVGVGDFCHIYDACSWRCLLVSICVG